MDKTILDQGLELLYFGMGTVFVFLTLLVFTTMLMSALVRRFGSADPEAVRLGIDAGIEPRIAKVIAEALRQHRDRK